MSLHRHRIAALLGAKKASLYVEDVFQTYTYDGTGSALSIVDGIQPNMVWGKSRSDATDHAIYDSLRGATYDLVTNNTAGQTPQSTGLTAFNADGFSLGSLAKLNTSGSTYVSWAFKEAPKFYKQAIVNKISGSNATVDLSPLGTVGMVFVKRTDAAGSWYVWHRSLDAGKLCFLEQTAAQATNGAITISGTTLTLVDGAIADGSYTVYAWAHDESANGLIQCGAFAPSAGAQDIILGFEPQFLMCRTADSATSSGWAIWDSMRGITMAEVGESIKANSAGAGNPASFCPTLLPNGFRWPSAWTQSSLTIYLAIRRGPMRVPTDGTTVFCPVAYTGSGATKQILPTGFPVDMSFLRPWRNDIVSGVCGDRLRGDGVRLILAANTTESKNANFFGFHDSMQFRVGTDTEYNPTGGMPCLAECFRRAPGFFDIVCYTGVGADTPMPHNLGSDPGMILIRSRSYASYWIMYHSGLQFSQYIDYAGQVQPGSMVTSISKTSFGLSSDNLVNRNGATFVAYIFGDTPGLCKPFNFLGSGASVDIQLGFEPRFIVLNTSRGYPHWPVFDTARGIVDGNDPMLRLGLTSAEVTSTDYVDPISTGFTAVSPLNGAATYGWACA